MLIGVDVSHHNGKILIRKVLDNCHINFVIAKATEGKTFVDDMFDYNMSAAKEYGLLRGAYHYVNSKELTKDSARDEALNFVSQVRPYGDCLLALDFEEQSLLSVAGVTYLSYVAECVKEMTKTPPLIYVSESVVKQFDFSKCVSMGCGLWAAKWRKNNIPKLWEIKDTDFTKAQPEEFGLVAIQQISNSALVNDGTMNSDVLSLDVDVAFMNHISWERYANPRFW